MTDWYTRRQQIDSVPVDDRGLRYGDGLFETIAIRSGSPRLWKYHVERLSDGCQRLGIPSPDAKELEGDLDHVLLQNPVADATARIIVTAGDGKRGYRRTSDTGPRVLIGLSDAVTVNRGAYETGVISRKCATTLAPQPALAGIKSLNRLEQVLARQEWNDENVFEGLLCDTDGQLICGTMSNVFVVHGKSLRTPRVDRCGVAGVMRRHIIELLEAEGISAIEDQIPWDDVSTADEMFLCNSQLGIVPVRECASRTLPVGTLTRSIMDLLSRHGISECQP